MFVPTKRLLGLWSVSARASVDFLNKVLLEIFCWFQRIIFGFIRVPSSGVASVLAITYMSKDVFYRVF